MFSEAPKLDLSGLSGRAIKVRAGEPIKIDIPIVGSPTPTVTWSKDGKDVPNGPKVSKVIVLYCHQGKQIKLHSLHMKDISILIIIVGSVRKQ